jgi:integrase
VLWSSKTKRSIVHALVFVRLAHDRRFLGAVLFVLVLFVFMRISGRHGVSHDHEGPPYGKILDESPTGKATFLTTEFGRPFSANGFGNWFRKKCDEAGLPHCTAHGLRKAAAARLAELGAPENEIMAITGHRTSKEMIRYTRGARMPTPPGRITSPVARRSQPMH